MEWPPEELRKVAERVRSGSQEVHTPRDVLRWYGYERRGSFIVWAIKRDLVDLQLQTDPDIEYPYLDGELRFQELQTTVAPTQDANAAGGDELATIFISSQSEDPTQRIGRLPSANTPPTSVNPSSTVAEAVTLMILNDFSQLPVMQGGRTLKGAVSWQSIGTSLSLGRPCVSVQDCIEDALVLESSVSLFSAIPTIIEQGFVLVRDEQHLISGIVTTSDLSLQFRMLAEPFLLLGETERHLRRLSNGKFSESEVRAAKDPNDILREIRNLSDLTFGEHIRLLENPDRWSALRLNIDRSTFVKHLNEVRDIRNGVMHFDPDGTAPSELEKLRQFVRLLGALGSH